MRAAAALELLVVPDDEPAPPAPTIRPLEHPGSFLAYLTLQALAEAARWTRLQRELVEGRRLWADVRPGIDRALLERRGELERAAYVMPRATARDCDPG